MDQIKQAAADLVAGYTKRANLDAIKGMIQDVAARAPGEFKRTLTDPNRTVLRNTLIGGGLGAGAGLVGSTRGRRMGDVTRGALLGGTLGGAGTFAAKNLGSLADAVTAKAPGPTPVEPGSGDGGGGYAEKAKQIIANQEPGEGSNWYKFWQRPATMGTGGLLAYDSASRAIRERTGGSAAGKTYESFMTPNRGEAKFRSKLGPDSRVVKLFDNLGITQKPYARQTGLRDRFFEMLDDMDPAVNKKLERAALKPSLDALRAHSSNETDIAKLIRQSGKVTDLNRGVVNTGKGQAELLQATERLQKRAAADESESGDEPGR